MKINIFWFRRDLRFNDNSALADALDAGLPVLPLYIFDDNILKELPLDDPRIDFVYENLSFINKELIKTGSSILVRKGDPLKIWKELIVSFDINEVYINKDYEPYAIQRDNSIDLLLGNSGIRLHRFKDQVIFEEGEILKSDNKPYTVFTPYCRKWITKFTVEGSPKTKQVNLNKLYNCNFQFPSLSDIGYRKSNIRVKTFDLSVIKDYDKFRNFPAADYTTHLSPHLRFGTFSIREAVLTAAEENPVFLNELIWREFFMQILFHFPDVVTSNFRPAYDNIQWRNNDKEFLRWCRGETGYPIVDAGIRQLNETGFMHNRVRMITAGFLCKNLLIDWRWGEAYFAQKLLDYELSSNNGNWQWAAGTGCDAAPFFRIFNPETQQKKFDPENEYVKQWVKDLGKQGYPEKMVDQDFTRQRAIEVYKNGIKRKIS